MADSRYEDAAFTLRSDRKLLTLSPSLCPVVVRARGSEVALTTNQVLQTPTRRSMASLQGARGAATRGKCLSSSTQCRAVAHQRVSCSQTASRVHTRAQASGATSAECERDARWHNVKEGTWKWKGHSIRYAIVIILSQCRTADAVVRLGCAVPAVLLAMVQRWGVGPRAMIQRKTCQQSCRYQRSGDSGVPVLLVHGFGANADHWRKNTPGMRLNANEYSLTPHWHCILAYK